MLVRNKKDVIDRLSASGEALSNFGVKRYGLFGSFLRGNETEKSDVDLLVEFQPGRKSFDSFMNLSYFLEELFGRKVDLVTPESLSPHIGPKILAEIEYGIID
jgi:predicted nucleotidyltransferase